MIERNYDIYGLVRIRIVSRHRSILKGLDFPLSYFETDRHSEEPEIILKIGDFFPSNQESYLIDHKYHVNENYIYFEEKTGRTKMKFEINGFENGPIEIKFHGKVAGIYNLIASNLLAQDQVLIPMMGLKLASKGLFLAHGCGIVSNNQAHLFLGRGGSLKTTIAMNAVARNMKLLGDDRIIIDPSKMKVYSFPFFPRMIEYIIKRNSGEQLNIISKLNLMRSLRQDFPRIMSIWQHGPVPIKSLNLLSRRETNATRLIKSKIEKRIAIDMMNANNKAERSSSSIPRMTYNRFPELMNAYSFVFPDSSIAHDQENLGKILENISDEIASYRIEIPRELEREDFDALI